jgi:sulfatase modifying factor 1
VNLEAALTALARRVHQPELSPLELAELAWLRGLVATATATVTPVSPVEPTPPPPPASPREPAPTTPTSVEARLPTTTTDPPDEQPPPTSGVDERVEVQPARARWLDRAVARLGRFEAVGRAVLDPIASARLSARLHDVVAVTRPGAAPVTTLWVLEDTAGHLEPWRDEVADLVLAARRSGRFVQVAHAQVGRDGALSMAGGAPRPPLRRPAGSTSAPALDLRALPTTGGTTLVLVITDGLGPAMYRDTWSALDGVPGDVRLVWVHPWGRALWHRTPAALLEAATPGPWSRRAPTAALVSFDRRALTRLEDHAQGRSPRRIAGRRLPEGGPRPTSPAVLDDTTRIQRFTRAASGPSRLVMALAATVPGDVDVELLLALGQELGGDRVTRHHLTEVLASGLWRRVEGERLVVSPRSDEVRRAAVGWLPRERVRDILRFLMRWTAQNGRRAASLGIPVDLLWQVHGEHREDAGGGRATGAAWLAEVVELAAIEVPDGVRGALRRAGRRWSAGEVVHRALGGELEMVYIPAGTFLMGRPERPPEGSLDKAAEKASWRARESPQHGVKLSAFTMSTTPVTQAQYAALMGPNPSYFKDRPDSAQRPVENVSWYDAVRFCNRLSVKDGLTAAYLIGEGDEPTVKPTLVANGYRLPTEAEWEYACRAGTTRSFWSGDTEADLERVGWFDENSGAETHPVACKDANGWGLHDMHGNVWEWCWDWYDEGWYKRPEASQADPTGPPRGVLRVLRGGSYWVTAVVCRSASRSRDGPRARVQNWGFRVVLPAAAAR